MARAACPITRDEFREYAEPMTIMVNGAIVEVPTKEFSTDSLGWYLSGRITVTINGVKCPCQIQISAQLVGSKELV